MRLLLCIGLLFFCPALLAQKNIEKSIVVQSGQALSLEFDYPELIKVYASTTNQLVIKGKVSINRGEHDDAFEIRTETKGNEVRVYSILPDKDKLPKRLLIKKGEQEYYFKTDNYNSPEVQKFLEENGGDYSYMNNGVIIEVELEVYIPKNIPTLIDAKYGLVEVKNCNAPLSIIAKYGGADVTVPTQGISELSAHIQYGEILTNLKEKPIVSEFEKGNRHNNETLITYKLGSGNKVSVDSKYGKVYLRREF